MFACYMKLTSSDISLYFVQWMKMVETRLSRLSTGQVLQEEGRFVGVSSCSEQTCWKTGCRPFQSASPGTHTHAALIWDWQTGKNEEKGNLHCPPHHPGNHSGRLDWMSDVRKVLKNAGHSIFKCQRGSEWGRARVCRHHQRLENWDFIGHFPEWVLWCAVRRHHHQQTDKRQTKPWSQNGSGSKSAREKKHNLALDFCQTAV